MAHPLYIHTYIHTYKEISETNGVLGKEYVREAGTGIVVCTVQ
jgi:hypothetical protein